MFENPPLNDPRGAFPAILQKERDIYIYTYIIYIIYIGDHSGVICLPSLQLIAMTKNARVIQALTQLDLLPGSYFTERNLLKLTTITPPKKIKKVKNQLTKTFSPSCVFFSLSYHVKHHPFSAQHLPRSPSVSRLHSYLHRCFSWCWSLNGRGPSRGRILDD